MPIRLTIEITSPLDPDDRDLLSGVAVMTLAIANHEMAKTRFPDTFGDDDGLRAHEEGAKPAPSPCGYIDTKEPTRICIGDAGHPGRHRFRRIPVNGDGAPDLPN